MGLAVPSGNWFCRRIHWICLLNVFKSTVLGPWNFGGDSRRSSSGISLLSPGQLISHCLAQWRFDADRDWTSFWGSSSAVKVREGIAEDKSVAYKTLSSATFARFVSLQMLSVVRVEALEHPGKMTSLIWWMPSVSNSQSHSFKNILVS